MTLSTGTPNNVIVGFATAYLAVAGTARPAKPTVAGTKVYTVSTPWAQIGFTETGVTIDVDRKTNDIMVEEQSTPVAEVTDTQSITVAWTFAEDIIANMISAYGGAVTATTVAAASSITGSSTINLSDTIATPALCFTATNTFGLQRLVYIPAVAASGKVSTKYLRNKSPHTYPVTFKALCDPSLIVIEDLTAVATS